MSEHKTNLNYWLLTFIIGVIVAVVSHYIIKGKFLEANVSLANSDNSNPPTKIQENRQPPTVQRRPEPKKDIRTSEFRGNVGKWSALFHLTFDYKENKIFGTYYYPNRPSVIYTIQGKIFGRNIELTEYTDKEVTATCKLQTDDNICFSGVMNNADGRNLNMNFCSVIE